MFGKNHILKQNLNNGDSLWVQEMFYTIQGEGLYAGWPAIFIRMAGCNLRCYFCDTDFESSNTHLSVKEILANIKAMKARTSLVVITGGEPFRQDIVPLTKELSLLGYKIQIETAGTLWLPGLPTECEIICSPKTGKINPEMSRAAGWKYIIQAGQCSLNDGLPVYSTQQEGKEKSLARPLNSAPVYVQPCDVQDEAKNKENTKATATIAMQYGYRISLQTHKILELP